MDSSHAVDLRSEPTMKPKNKTSSRPTAVAAVADAPRPAATTVAGASTQRPVVERLSTGVPGLDEILVGGLIRRCAYLLKGGPGCGKTTIGLHFLSTGRKNGESVLYISLSEPEAQIRLNAARLGMDLTGVEFLDLSPSPEFFAKVESYDIFSPAEVEREPMTMEIVKAIEKHRPARVFLDSMTQFRYLSTDVYQYRKQATSFLRFLVNKGATVLFTSEGTPDLPDDDLKFMADGVLELTYTPERRTLAISKFRGSSFQPGEHSVRLSEDGMTVYPQILSTRIRWDFVSEPMSSGVPELDELLHGGLERGTVTIITGPTGAGKTTLGLQFIKEASGRGERSVVYTFEEGADTLMNRCSDINIPVRKMVEQGVLSIMQAESRYTPEEFAHRVRRDVEQHERRIVMIDSVKGYSLCVQGSDFTEHLHKLGMFLKGMGVTLLLINETKSVTGDFQATDGSVSYLADNIVFLRYLELNGELRKAIGVLKKRAGDFEKTMREIAITKYGLKVGGPMTGLRGILSGKPEFVEKTHPMPSASCPPPLASSR